MPAEPVEQFGAFFHYGKIGGKIGIENIIKPDIDLSPQCRPPLATLFVFDLRWWSENREKVFCSRALPRGFNVGV
jgi:hypothetical protein